MSSPGAKKQPDKKKVVQETWDDDRVRAFLEAPPYDGGGDLDFVRLLRAYRGMRPGDFERFIRFFVEAGHNLDARNRHLQTFVTYISRHRLSQPFVAILIGAGAAPARPAP